LVILDRNWLEFEFVLFNGIGFVLFVELKFVEPFNGEVLF